MLGQNYFTCKTIGWPVVLAAAMAAWYGEKKTHSILRLPPMPRPPIETRPPTLDELIEAQPKLGGDERRGRI